MPTSRNAVVNKYYAFYGLQLGALLFQELRVLILKRWVIARFFQSNTTHEAIAQRSWRATHREIGSQLAGFSDWVGLYANPRVREQQCTAMRKGLGKTSRGYGRPP